MLRDCQYETDVFLNRISLLGEKLGVLLMQFPPSFGGERLPDLENFLQKLPSQHSYAVEIRNKSWLNKKFFSVLQNSKVALAWTDSSLMAPINEVTSNFLYFRWEGDRKKVNGTLGIIEAARDEDLKLEAEKIKPFLGKMAVFGYFGKYYSGYPPSDVAILRTNMNTNS
jgi:uncharacterized protein YecE (DUF72 family)